MLTSIIIPCKNRLNHLSFTLPITRKMEGEYEIIVVDYNCPMGASDYVKAVFGMDQRIVTVKAEVGAKEWNLSHSRNLGYKVSKGDVLLFLDADTKVRSNFLVSHPLNGLEFYTGEWLHASGCCMVGRSEFEMVKGYNEVCEGWGTEDYDLYRRLEAIGVSRKYFNKKLFWNLQHHDKTRNEYHDRLDIHASNERNFQRCQKEFRSCVK